MFNINSWFESLLTSWWSWKVSTRAVQLKVARDGHVCGRSVSELRAFLACISLDTYRHIRACRKQGIAATYWPFR